MQVACLKDLEDIASKKIPSKAWDYYRSGADTEFTLRDNENAFQRYRFRPRVLRDVSKIDASTSVLGTSVNFPVCIASTAMQRLASSRGELDTARGASTKGTLMMLSTLSTTSLEDVAHEFNNWTVGRGGLWFQLYIYKNREVTEKLVKRAETAGYRVLCLTVDTPYLGNRRADARNKFEMPPGLKLANFEDSMAGGIAEKGSWLLEYSQSLFDPSVSWQDIDWLRKITKLKIVLKGIVTGKWADTPLVLVHSMHEVLGLLSDYGKLWIAEIRFVMKDRPLPLAEDAELAVHHGVDGILVSNHGARQLDGAPATVSVELFGTGDGKTDWKIDQDFVWKLQIDALREVVNAVQGRCEVYLDGGVRTGSDVVKALCMGAKAVFIGRPILWGLAYKGAAGVEEVLSILAREVRSTMGLLGATKIDELTQEMVAPSLPSKF
ncbi:hydroxyacid oxidase 1 [Galendromus occidentalis]|uniref:Hydroxyacid oxidase 1 n=1 Tax=Galendromus occidentalis TaxID=34638 RepID=A0AAJ7SGE4_9ACAR|nr:hydroxyacid oxidase 1 [Galendromus occidentalis]